MKNDVVVNEIVEALNKHNLRINYELSFPRYNIMPDEVRLALSVLQNHGMKITLNLEPIKK